MAPYLDRRLLVLVGLVLGLWLGPVLTGYFIRPETLIYRHGNESRPVVALTFDDGPSARFTPQILALLAQHRVRATFFLLGRHAQRYPQLVQALAAAGHEIGNHTYSHPHLDQINQDTLAQELEKTAAVLARLGVSLNGLFRPPYSKLPQNLAVYLGQINHKVILWSIDSGDWQGYPTSKIVDRVLNNLRNGAIVVFHDNNEYDGGNRQPTVEALRILLPRFQSRNLRCVTVSELLHCR
ncbi:MAG: polysaccharide deacetylase family protein [Desulfobacteraceae bacterium]